jgi:hypothetical protein
MIRGRAPREAARSNRREQREVEISPQERRVLTKDMTGNLRESYALPEKNSRRIIAEDAASPGASGWRRLVAWPNSVGVR